MPQQQHKGSGHQTDSVAISPLLLGMAENVAKVVTEAERFCLICGGDEHLAESLSPPMLGWELVRDKRGRPSNDKVVDGGHEASSAVQVSAMREEDNKELWTRCLTVVVVVELERQ